MAGPRSYHDVCGIARALDVVGERWALLVLRELVLGPKRFTDLRAALPHIGPDMLSVRLRELIANGLVERRDTPPPQAARLFSLTAEGAAIEPVLTALGRFGAAMPMTDPGAGMSFDAHVLSFRTMFVPALAAGPPVAVQLELEGHPFAASVADGVLTLDPGTVPGAAATITGTADAVLAVAHGRRDASDAEAAGELRVAGDEGAALRFLAMFRLPPDVLGACSPS